MYPVKVGDIRVKSYRHGDVLTARDVKIEVMSSEGWAPLRGVSQAEIIVTDGAQVRMVLTVSPVDIDIHMPPGQVEAYRGT